MPAATFRHGKPLMIDHTPASGNLTAGDIVLLATTTGLTCGIAHVDIANDTKGALAVGGGVYDCKIAANATKGAKLYVDATNTNAALTATSTNNALFGYLAETNALGANAVCEVVHEPYV